jgi:hypothetical protein
VDVAIGLVIAFIWWNGLKEFLNMIGRIDILPFFVYNTFVEVDKDG